MTQSDEQCDHVNCEEPVEVVRVYLPHDTEHGYCEDHDPLEDGIAADAFEEVST